MNRIASLFSTAALAGSLLTAGIVSHAANYNLYLVPTGATSNLPLTTKSVSFRVLVDINTPGVNTLTIGPAIAVKTPNSVLKFTTLAAGAVVSASFAPDKSQFQPAVADAVAQGQDPAGAPALWDQTAKLNYATRTVAGQEVKYVQGGVGHTAYNDTTLGVVDAIPVGTYTVGSYSISLNTVAGGITNGSSVAFQLPSAFGLADPNSNTTQDFFSDSVGNPTVSFPNNGTTKFNSLTYTFGTSATGTPAPSSLLVVAMGAVPMVGVLRRRRHLKK